VRGGGGDAGGERPEAGAPGERRGAEEPEAERVQAQSDSGGAPQ